MLVSFQIFKVGQHFLQNSYHMSLAINDYMFVYVTCYVRCLTQGHNLCYQKCILFPNKLWFFSINFVKFHLNKANVYIILLNNKSHSNTAVHTLGSVSFGWSISVRYLASVSSAGLVFSCPPSCKTPCNAREDTLEGKRRHSKNWLDNIQK